MKRCRACSKASSPKRGFTPCTGLVAVAWPSCRSRHHPQEAWALGDGSPTALRAGRSGSGMCGAERVVAALPDVCAPSAVQRQGCSELERSPVQPAGSRRPPCTDRCPLQRCKAHTRLSEHVSAVEPTASACRFSVQHSSITQRAGLHAHHASLLHHWSCWRPMVRSHGSASSLTVLFASCLPPGRTLNLQQAVILSADSRASHMRTGLANQALAACSTSSGIWCFVR